MKNDRRQRTRIENRRHAVFIGIICLIVFAVLIGIVYGVGTWLENRDHEKTAVHGDLSGVFEETPTVTVNGKTYKQRKNLTTILFLGVDKSTDAASVGLRNGGQADFILLMVIDDDRKTLNMLQIDRDTMAEITILGILGNDAGTRNAQICLSHGFGDGGEQSSKLTAQAVSKLLLGTNVDFHITMCMDGISELNDALGGITVTLQDDFTSLDSTMSSGKTLTLQGIQAEYYVRGRMNVGIGTNEARQIRQQDYLSKVKNVLDEKIRQSGEFIGMLFDTMQPYLETDMKRGRLVNIAWASREYTRSPIAQLPGEHKIGEDGFMEFHADEQGIADYVLSVFYEAID